MSRHVLRIRLSAYLLSTWLAVLAPPVLSAAPTIFFVVRHAERAQAVGTDQLDLIGMRRAEHLRDVLGSQPISAVYSSKFRRTWQTATPTALANGVEIAPYGSRSRLVGSDLVFGFHQLVP